VQRSGDLQPVTDAKADDPGVVDLAQAVVGRMLNLGGLAALMIAGQRVGIGADGADRVVQIDAAAHARITAKRLGQQPARGGCAVDATFT